MQAALFPSTLGVGYESGFQQQTFHFSSLTPEADDLQEQARGEKLSTENSVTQPITLVARKEPEGQHTAKQGRC